MKSRSGFTIIELLAVVAIIGILAAIAAPRYANTKTRAYVAHMKTDLRNLAVAQEAFMADSSTFYSGVVPAPGLVYQPTPGVVITLSSVSLTGWGAVATFPGGTAETCALYVGTGGPIAPATVEGEIACN